MAIQTWIRLPGPTPSSQTCAVVNTGYGLMGISRGGAQDRWWFVPSMAVTTDTTWLMFALGARFRLL